MFGAYKPPWVRKEDFLKTPFNYCDRWCERCQFKHICRVFQREQKSKEAWIKQGKDPNSLDYVFETVRENLEETAKLLKKDAQKWGIDLDEIEDSDCQLLPEPEEFPLYNLAFKFSQKLEKLADDLRLVPEGADEYLILEGIKVISHYQSLIPPKVYRALISKAEEEEEKKMGIYVLDAETSAFIVIRGLLAVAEVLKNLARHRPLGVLRKNCLRLAKISLKLAEMIDWEFNLGII